MSQFIKLNVVANRSGEPTWVNVHHIQRFWASKFGTYDDKNGASLEMKGGGVFYVAQTPEQILAMIEKRETTSKS